MEVHESGGFVMGRLRQRVRGSILGLGVGPATPSGLYGSIEDSHITSL